MPVRVPRLQPFPPAAVPAIRATAAEDLLFFARRVYGFDRFTDELHGPLARFLTATHLYDGRPALQKLELGPRGCYKSSLSTVCYPLWLIVRDPTIRVLIDSDLRAQAKKWAKLVRRHLETNARLRQLYGDLRRDSGWTDDEFTVQRDVEFAEPTVMTSGIDQVVVGLHFPYPGGIVIDDLVNNRNIGSKEQLDKSEEHVNDMAPIVEDGWMLLVGTRWHDDDVYARKLRDASGGRPMRDIVDQLYAESEDPRFPNGSQIGDWLVFFRKPYFPGRDGKPDTDRPIIPKYTPDYLARQKRILGAYRYAAVYDQDPISDETARFKKDQVERRWSHETLPPAGELQVTMTLDPAIGESRAAAYSAITSAALHRATRRKFVLQAWHDKTSDLETTRKLFELYEALVRDGYTVRAVGLEEYAMQRIFRTLIHQEEDRRGYTLPLRMLGRGASRETRMSKEARIDALIPDFEELLWEMGPGMADLEEELERYPSGRAKDLVDSLAWHLPLQRVLSALVFPMFDQDRHVTIERPTRFDRVLMALYRPLLDEDFGVVVLGRSQRVWWALEEAIIPRGTPTTDLVGLLYGPREQWKIPKGRVLVAPHELNLREELIRNRFPVRLGRAYSDPSAPLTRVQTLLERDRLFVMSHLEELVRELNTLVWPEKTQAAVLRMPEMRMAKVLGAMQIAVWTEDPPERVPWPTTQQAAVDREAERVLEGVAPALRREPIATGYGYQS